MFMQGRISRSFSSDSNKGNSSNKRFGRRNFEDSLSVKCLFASRKQ